MEEHRFPHKYGAVWTRHGRTATSTTTTGKGSRPMHAPTSGSRSATSRASIRTTPTTSIAGSSTTLLLQHAHELGADVYEGVAVTDVDFPSRRLPRDPVHDGPARRWACKRADGRRRQRPAARCSATSSSSKIKDPVFDQYAIHTWFEGSTARRPMAKGEQQGRLHLHPLPADHEHLDVADSDHRDDHQHRRRDAEEELRQSRARAGRSSSGTPSAAGRSCTTRCARSKQMRPFKDEGDYSYAMKQISGDGLLMVGDAGRFVDPIFSTGVSIALNSARFASQGHPGGARDRRLLRGQRSAPTKPRSGAGTKNWYNFITVYYRLNVLFTAFIQRSAIPARRAQAAAGRRLRRGGAARC